MIDAGVTPQATKDNVKHWKARQRYSATWNIDPFLQGCDQLDIIILVIDFSARVRQSYYGKGFQIKVTTVANVLSYITMYIHLVGKSCPFKTTEDDYILPVKRLIEGLRSNNLPPLIPQLALPISITNDCCAKVLLSKSPYIQATGDLIIIDFYYLLLCGEYTTLLYVQLRDGTLMRSTRTKQFMLGDVGFWKGGCKISLNSPLHLLLQAELPTLKITNSEEQAHGKNHTQRVL